MVLINTTGDIRGQGGFSLQTEGRPFVLRFIHADGNEEAGAVANRCEHRHSVYHLILVKKGTGFFPVDGKRVEVKPGTLLFISPGQRHSLGVGRGERIIYGEITFEFLDEEGIPLTGDWGFLFSRLAGERVTAPAAMHTDGTGMAQRVASILGELESFRPLLPRPVLFHLSTSSLLAKLLLDMTVSFFRNPAGREDGNPMERIRDYIRGNYQLPLNLDDLASIGSFNTKYLSRRFKELFGQSPIEYRDSLRMESACALLKKTACPVGDIAAKCGFSDIYYFSRVFKKKKGMSPRQYRSAGQSV